MYRAFWSRNKTKVGSRRKKSKREEVFQVLWFWRYLLSRRKDEGGQERNKYSVLIETCPLQNDQSSALLNQMEISEPESLCHELNLNLDPLSGFFRPDKPSPSFIAYFIQICSSPLKARKVLLHLRMGGIHQGTASAFHQGKRTTKLPQENVCSPTHLSWPNELQYYP